MKKFIYGIYKKFKQSGYLRIPYKDLDHFNCEIPADKNFVDIVSVSFNNEQVVYHQQRLLKKYFKDPFVHTIIDNSSRSEKSQLIKDICKENNIGYIRLPDNFASGSDSHGLALNWTYKNFIIPRAAKYFGLIDHDIYPVSNATALDKLKDQPFFGLKQTRDRIWYLWAGFCFFKRDYLQNKKIDFMPCNINGVYLDTGGANWESLYKNVNPGNLLFPQQTYGKLREGEIAQSDMVEYIGDWVHSFNGSYWMEVQAKENELNVFLNKY